MPRLNRGCDGDPRVDGDDTIFIGKQRVEIEFPDFRQIGRELCKFDEDQRDCIFVGGWDIAIGLENAGYAGARNQVVASLRSSGGSANALSLMTSTAVPPWPKTMTGPKVGSSAMPAMSSRAFGRRIIG